MIKEIKYIFFVFIISLFIFFTVKYYISDEFEKKYYKSINNLDSKLDLKKNSLIKLDSDTDNIIEYIDEKENKEKKLSQFKNFIINQKLMRLAKKDCIFLHCLPRGSEVDEKVFLSKQSKVWLQALNRVHVQKSILLYCFDKLR